MQLLADELVVLQVVDSISDETVRRTLKKTTVAKLTWGPLRRCAHAGWRPPQAAYGDTKRAYSSELCRRRKKRFEAVAEEDVVHSAPAKR